MRNPENVLNSLQEHSAQSGYVYDRLYRNLFNREFFLQAYQNMYYYSNGTLNPFTLSYLYGNDWTIYGYEIDKAF